MGAKPFIVKPMSSATDKAILDNIMSNMDTIPTWFERCKKTDDHALIISAGPSTRRFLRDHKDVVKKHSPVLCIKHALPLLEDAGVEPDFCVVLDPRPITDTSTLGHKRVDLYNKASKNTTFFVASMTHKSVTEHLMESGYKVIGWHALTPEMQHLNNEYKKRMGQMLITGGTSSGTRSIELSFFMGATKATCVGFDSSFDQPKPTNVKDAGGKQRYMKIKVQDKDFYTTGELIAQAQDFERLLDNVKHQSDVRVFDTGLETSLVNEIQKVKGNPCWPTRSWKEFR